MERDGSRLFVQLRFDTVTDDPEAGSPAVRGALAVVDLATETLIDLDPVAPGVQGIDLVGEPPHGKMTFQPRRRLLYVSSTGVALNVAGGIEKVDIDAGVSMGLVVTEKQIGLDLGGFVFTSEDGGYLMFHTEIIPSTHLTRFTVPGGISGISQFFGLLGDAVNVLVHDPSTNTLFLPSGDAFAPGTGVYAFDTDTDTLIGGAVNTGMRPHDILLIE
jgi:hypothetical protein